MRALILRGRPGLEENFNFVKNFPAQSQNMVDSAADPTERSGRGEDDVCDKEPRKVAGLNVFSQPRGVPY